MHILLTGGGTGGHVVPNLAIAEQLRSVGEVKLSYIGSHTGMEKKLVEEAGIPYYSVSTGKLRRYLDWQNLADAFKVPLGVVQAWRKLGQLKPDVVFSKGGFVAFPVVVAGWLRRIPVFVHDSDAIPGLTTKLSAPFAKKILLAYEGAAQRLKKYKDKIEVVGNPVHPRVFNGSLEAAKKLTGFSGKRPVLLVLGGSSGSQELNELIEKNKKALMERYDIIHQTGEGKGQELKEAHYFSVPFVDGLQDFYTLSTVAISRAGAGSIAELEALGIPSLLFPLGLHASRGDQAENAKEAIQKGGFMMGSLKEDLVEQLKNLEKKKVKSTPQKALDKILNLLIV